MCVNDTISKRFGGTLQQSNREENLAHGASEPLQTGRQAFGGISVEAFTISSRIRLKSSNPGAGMMMVSRLPPTSSVIRRKRPRGFSFNVNTKVFRSI